MTQKVMQLQNERYWLILHVTYYAVKQCEKDDPKTFSCMAEPHKKIFFLGSPSEDNIQSPPMPSRGQGLMFDILHSSTR